MKKYYKIWKQLTACAAGSYLTNRIDSLTYFIGKLARFVFFLILIFTIFKYTDKMAGYAKYQVVLFFLIFNFMDVLAQAFFRGIYYFKNDIKLGNFDYVVSKPVNPLFYSLSRMTDILDIIFLFPTIALIFFTAAKLSINLFSLNALLFLLLTAASLIIILGIHIISAAVTIWTMESENLIWFYRESMTIGRFPPEIYSPLIQFVFTYIMPVIVIVSFPAKALLGIISFSSVIIALVMAALFLLFSLLIWNAGLRHYSSASS